MGETTMWTFKQGDPVVYRPGFIATNLSETGRSLPDRQKKVVHGTVGDIEGSQVRIDADPPEDSGWFPAMLVEYDCSDAPLF